MARDAALLCPTEGQYVEGLACHSDGLVPGKDAVDLT